MRSARAQEPGPAVTINQLDTSAYPDMRAVVTVLDTTGSSVGGLPPGAFTALDREAAVEVLDAQRVLDASLNLGVILAIDVSGSMEGAPLAAAKDAAVDFVGQLDPGDSAALLAFSDTPRMVVPITSNRDALVEGINSLTAGGDTALYQAVGASAFAAGSSLRPRTAIVLLSDGENDSAVVEATEQSSLAAASSVRVPVYTISFGDGADPAYLGRLAAATNGRFFSADEADVSSVYSLLAEQLRGQFALTLRSAVPPDGADASLVVTVNVAGQQVSSAPFSFVRGESPPPPPPAPQPSTATEEGATEGGSSSAIPLVLAGLVGLVLLAMAVGFGVRTLANRRQQRRREREAGQHSDTPLPAPVASPASRAPEIQARIVALSGQGAGLAVQVGTIPIVIGSDEAADLRVERSGDIAPRHAQVWVRDGKIMLRHVGGQKKTMAMGRPVEWLILDEGDEFSVGPYQYRVEAAHTNGAGV